MKRTTVTLIILTFLTLFVAPSRGQEYAPLVREGTIGVARINLDNFDMKDFSDAIDNITSASVEYFEIECGMRNVRMGMAFMLGIPGMCMKALKEEGAHTLYFIVDVRPDDSTKRFIYFALPSREFNQERFVKRFKAYSLAPPSVLLECNGMTCWTFEIPELENSEFCGKTYLETSQIVKRPELEEAFQTVSSNKSLLTFVAPTSSSGGEGLAETVKAVLHYILSFLPDLNVGDLNECDAIEEKEAAFDKFVLSIDEETKRLLKYYAWNVDISNRSFRITVGANSEQDAERWNQLVEAGKEDLVKEAAHEDVDEFARQCGADVATNLANEAFDDVLKVVKFERSDSNLSLTFDKAFFLRNRATFLKAYANARRIVELNKLRADKKLKELATACRKYYDANDHFPSAYEQNGKTWIKAGTLLSYFTTKRRANIPGCAMLISDDGVFTKSPGESKTLSQITCGASNALVWVELADANDNRACVTLDEFYEQLQRRPEMKCGYLGAMADGSVRLIDKATSLETLREMASIEKVASDAPLERVNRSSERPEQDAAINLQELATACHAYYNVYRHFPSAYDKDGGTWQDSKEFKDFLPEGASFSGYAMLVNDDGIFTSTPGETTNLSDVIDGLANTIMFVELPDPNDNRACVTLDEFYDQLQNCPSKKIGYRVAMGDASVETLSRSIAFERLRAFATRASSDNTSEYSSESKKENDERAQATVKKLQIASLACGHYLSAYQQYPSAYERDGRTWKESETFKQFLPKDASLAGCAMLVDDDGIFMQEPGRASKFTEVRDGFGTIMFVELADPNDDRACITFDELYEQFQNCPRGKRGYRVACYGGDVATLPKYISLNNLRALTTKNAGDMYDVDLYEIEFVRPNPTLNPAPKDDELTPSPTTWRNLRKLADATLKYVNVAHAYPVAYHNNGNDWLKGNDLVHFLSAEFHVGQISGCAMLVDETGIFVPAPESRTNAGDVLDDASATIMFVELADPNEVRACITLEEFYEQLQKCPAERKGYLASMADGSIVTIPKTITRDELKAGVSKAGGDAIENLQ